MHSTYLFAQAAIAGLAAAAPTNQAFGNDNSAASNAMTRTTVYQPFYPKLERYARFAAASGDSYCYDPPYQAAVQKYINIGSTDTQATLFRGDIAKEFILAFPGTATQRDQKTDSEAQMTGYDDTFSGECNGCAVHTGFFRAWQSASDYTLQVVDEALAQYPTYNLTITGYSLGGALANLAFATFASHKKYPIEAAFTYGQPRVGNQQYADFVDKLSGATEEYPGLLHRVTHGQDGVPQLPGEEQGYRHSRTEYFEKEYESSETTYRCYGQEPDDCSKAHGHGYINNAHFMYSGVNMTADNCQ